MRSMTLTFFLKLEDFVLQLAMPPEITQLPPISTEITVEEYRNGIQKWREATSTSPSGRHLGVYKALLSIDGIAHDMTSMLNVVVRTGIAPRRWSNAISVLIEKDVGQPNINRLRVIHLFEADYNFFLKVTWARRLVQRGEDTHQFGDAQQGSRSGRTATDAVMLKRLTYDLTRILRSNLGTFDNDAKSCYDRIVNSVAMIAARRLGMPEAAVCTHATILEQDAIYSQDYIWHLRCIHYKHAWFDFIWHRSG